ncbi:MAG: endonuclease/exonuclease/phosphatase family protein [Bacteroidota bacterium]
MASVLRIFTRRFFIYSNVVLAVLFLLACLVPQLPPRAWWFIAFLGLIFPFLLAGLLLFFAGWLILWKPARLLISFIPILIGWGEIQKGIAFHGPSTFSEKKSPGTLRVVSWNVARFIELRKNNNKGSQTRLKMLDLIKQQDADVLCFQEFQTSLDPRYYDNITPIREMGYPYHYFSFDEDGDLNYYSSAIFSKYPIIDTAKIRFPRPSSPEVLLQADLLVGKDTIRVFTTHLQSFQFNPADYRRIEQIKSGQDSVIDNSRNIFAKWKRGVVNRSLQAEIAREVVSVSGYPRIFCADLNDIPNSYTYSLVKGGMQDAFLCKGSGIGRTFLGLSPTLRIDYVFADAQWEVRQFTRRMQSYSDHLMLVTDLALKPH